MKIYITRGELIAKELSFIDPSHYQFIDVINENIEYFKDLKEKIEKKILMTYGLNSL